MPYRSAEAPPPTAEPYVLVADDDATSRCFLGEALRQLGARVALGVDAASALEWACKEQFDLLLLDCRMPDGDAVSVLKRLRSNVTARSSSTPAVASSAELDLSEQRALQEAGFHAVLLKPCTVQDLRNVLSLAIVARDHLPLLDDGLALNASGSPAVVHALRQLFREELHHLDRELDALSADAIAFEARLHKLRSSCGFCGAASLAEHAASLQRHVKLAHSGAMLPLADFRRTLRQTIEALTTQ